MNWKRLKRRLLYWQNRSGREALLREEMDFHIESLTAELSAQGIDPAEARSRARKQFGNYTLRAEEASETWIAAWATDIGHDLRYAVRGLIRQPAFAIFAITILSLGIGATTTVFNVLNTLVLRPLPLAKPENLVWIANSGQEGLSGSTIQVSHITDMQANSRTLTAISGYMAFYGAGETLVGDKGNLERITNVPISCGFLTTLGISPMLGRNFTNEECQWKAQPTALISHHYWMRRLEGRKDIVGSQLLFNGKQVTVIGILPESFDFGALFAPGLKVEALTPFPLSKETDRWGNTMSVIGRLVPGASVPAAQSELNALLSASSKIQGRNEFRPFVESLPEYISGSTRSLLWIIAAAVLIVMGIVCANLASLQLARAAVRQKEFAIRTSLGAGRLRIIRQMLVECLLLTSLGCALGIGFTFLGTTAIARLDSIRIPMLSQVKVDYETILFALAIATLSSLVFGLLPGLQFNSGVIHDSLKDSTRGGTVGQKQTWTRNLLVIGEVAFACLLLVSAGLLVRSMLNLMDVHLGFVPDRAVSMRINLDNNNLPQAQEILRRAREIPGIESASLTDSMPFGKNRSWGIADATRAKRREDWEPSFVRIVSDGFFSSLGIRILEGRDFTERDRASTEPVVVINQAAANRFWPGQSAVGKRAIAGGDTPRLIIGVVENLRHVKLEESSGLEFYLSMRQTDDRNGTELVVRSSTPIATLSNSLKQAVLPIDPSANASEIIELTSLVSRVASPRRILLLSLVGFALFALLLASLGIYALISYTVEQRAKELGIRLALGAKGSRLKLDILIHTLRLVLTGAVLGCLCAVPIASAMKSLLFGVTPLDPLSFLVAVLTFTSVAMLAGYLPARRISSIDPLEALRQDG